MKKSSKVGIVIIVLVAIVGIVVGSYFIKEGKKSDVIAYQNKADRYKLYIRNEQTKEDKLLVDIGVINVCTVNDWVYYMTGDFEGIFKIKTDGTENTKVSSLEVMPTISANTLVESSVDDGNIIYTITQLKEVGNTTEIPELHYKLNLKDDTITQMDCLKEG